MAGWPALLALTRARCSPSTSPAPQTTREVGQECLKLLTAGRGGLLGAGHTWLAGPADAAEVAEATAGGAATSAAAGPAGPPAPPLLARLRERASNRLFSLKEDALDALSDAGLLQVSASRGAVLAGGATGLALLGVLALLAAHAARLHALLDASGSN